MAGTLDLFEPEPEPPQPLAEGAWLLRGFVIDDAERLLTDLHQVAARARFRHQVTPGGFSMSAAMTSCGELGWVTDRDGYRYSPTDPLDDQPGRRCLNPSSSWQRVRPIARDTLVLPPRAA